METVKKIEDTWGKYNPAMLGLVVEYLGTSTPVFCRSLYSVLADYHDGNWPPSRATMVKYHDESIKRLDNYRDIVPVAHRIESKPEEFVSPEEGLRRIKEILEKIGEKAVLR